MSSPPSSSEDRLSLLCRTLDLLPNPGFVVDLSGCIVGWNRRLETLSGVSREEMVGKDGTACGITFYGDERPPLVDLVVPSRTPPDLSLYAILEQDPGTVSAEVHLPCIRGGAGGQVIVKAAVVTDLSGTVIGGIETLTDIFTQRRAIEGLLSANANLHLVNRVVRHDIMNELTIVLGYLDLAGESITDPETKEDLVRVSLGARQIQQRIEFTREIQSHGTVLPRWQYLDEAVADALQNASSGVPSVTVRGGAVRLFADPLLVRVIATLLTSTCQRGGDRGELWSEEQGNHLCIIYTDNGDGILEYEKERIFGGDYDAVRGYGLFLDREILAVTGITLQEIGDPDKGARFEMIVPAGAYEFFTGPQVPDSSQDR
ncbi:PAS domain-containing protein [Methanosphaerula subterraneus]|uniref:PAS domain-containing sensor histidine kinase n=1 Tax=Methanosphaerula subterraneus TaxID=3350244 RepID=UPI003F862227